MLTTYTNEDRDAKGAVTLCLASFPVRDSNPGLLRANTRERWPAACPSVNSPYGDRTRVSSVKTRYPDHWTKGDQPVSLSLFSPLALTAVGFEPTPED